MLSALHIAFTTTEGYKYFYVTRNYFTVPLDNSRTVQNFNIYMSINLLVHTQWHPWTLSSTHTCVEKWNSIKHSERVKKYWPLLTTNKKCNKSAQQQQQQGGANGQKRKSKLK